MMVLQTAFISKQLTDSTGTLTDWGDAAATPVEIDLSTKLGREFQIVARITGNGTAPGVSKTVTVNLYQSVSKITTRTNVPTALAPRKVAATAITITNDTSTVERQHLVAISGTTIKANSRYLYVSFDAAASLSTGATATVTLDLVRYEDASSKLVT